jgi:SAM-dependent methyltransferase
MAIADEHTGVESQRAIWNELVGHAWVKYAATHDEQAAPFGHAVMDALGGLLGARVLDVGCGTGAAAAQLVERGAIDVLGVDLSVPMIDAARASAGAHTRFEIGDAAALELPGTFDFVFSRFGVMFFDDPIAAFAGLRALGTDNARLGFCCWGQPSDNPVMTLPVMSSVAVLGPPQFAGPGEPGPFSLSSPEIIRDVLTTAGWDQIEVRELALDPPHPAGDAEAVADMTLEFNPLLVQGLQREPTKRAAVREAIVAALLPLERTSVVHLGASALIVTARGHR